ncbi:MAG: alpha/beta fold hydrolase [Opitutaceae bacterium]
MRQKIILSFTLFAAIAHGLPAATEAERRAHVDWMNQNLPAVPTWAEWQKKTGALPPDFDVLPSANYLPDPFKSQDGKAVRMPGGWPARRAEIRQQFEKYVVGSLPPKPKIDRIVPLDETKGEGYTIRKVRLEYGPEGKITSEVTVTLPAGPGPFPVLIGGGSWGSSLIRRGYASCEYPSSVDQVTNLPELYPNFDFATMGQRAWTAQLVVDYLYTLPEIDKARIAINGYSRGGKMAALAAAFDERIAAVVAGSTGVGGVLPWRLSGERGMGEGVESTTRMFPLWFAPQLRFFSGREDRLPVDANLLIALVAPRAFLMEWGLNDEVSNVWGGEQSFHSALKVYQALGQPGRLGVLRVPGFHGANDIEKSIDWLDIQFGRSPRTWRNDLLFSWDFAEWQKRSGETLRSRGGVPPAVSVSATSLPDWEKQKGQLQNAMNWVLGEAPPRLPPAAGRGGAGGGRGGPAATSMKPIANAGQLGPDVAGWVIGRNSVEFGWNDPARAAADTRRIRFGSGLTGDLYFPAGTPENAKLPTVIWLHGYSYPLGYMWVYRRDLHPVLALVRAGYAVLAFDQCGFGARQAEIAPFYDRYPHWSQLGRMVEDARAAIDAVEKDANVDAKQISLFGYTLGGMVALHTAAVDPRVKSVVSVSGFTPMRTDTADRPTGGLARFSQIRPVAPRLGLFIGREKDVPYDYDALIAAVAPRPVLVVQTTMDRDANVADVHSAVESARRIYALSNAADQLKLDEPVDYQRFPAATQDRAIEWLKTKR